MPEPFQVVVADPAWLFNDRLGEYEMRGAEANYRVMSTYEICQLAESNFHTRELTVMGQPVAQDAILFLWRVAAMQQSALDVVRAWGFTLKTELVWLKKTKTGRRWFGLGWTLRAEHEVCLVATRGKPQLANHSTRTTFVTELDLAGLSAKVGRHSEKPDEFYRIVEELHPGPRLELFSRRQRAGWTCVGDEVSV